MPEGWDILDHLYSLDEVRAIVGDHDGALDFWIRVGLLVNVPSVPGPPVFSFHELVWAHVVSGLLEIGVQPGNFERLHDSAVDPLVNSWGFRRGPIRIGVDLVDLRTVVYEKAAAVLRSRT